MMQVGHPSLLLQISQVFIQIAHDQEGSMSEKQTPSGRAF